MQAISRRHEHLQAGIVGGLAALSAASLILVGYQKGSAPGSAILWVGVLGLALLAVLAYLRPLIPVCIALAFLTSPIQLVLTLQQSALISGFLLAAAAIGLLRTVHLKALVSDPMILPIGIFAAYGLFSAAYGLSAGNEPAYVFGDCFQILEFGLVYLLISQLLTQPREIRLLLKILFVSILATILVELILFALGPGAANILPSWEGDTDGILRTIDIDATFLFALLFNLDPLARHSGRRLWIWVALVPTVANIALSLSRGLWLCTLLVVIISVILQSQAKRKRLVKSFAFVAVCLVLLAAAWKTGSDTDGNLLNVLEGRILYGVDQVEQGLAGTESLATRRFLEMAIVGPQVAAQPWIGHGLGATYVIGGFAVLDQVTRAPIDHHFIHNLYLVTAFRMGGVGLALLLWIVVRYFRRTLGAYRGLPDFNKALTVGFVASVGGQLVLSLTQPTLTDHPTCAVIACAMALSSRLALNHNRAHQPQPAHAVER